MVPIAGGVPEPVPDVDLLSSMFNNKLDRVGSLCGSVGSFHPGLHPSYLETSSSYASPMKNAQPCTGQGACGTLIG